MGPMACGNSLHDIQIKVMSYLPPTAVRFVAEEDLDSFAAEILSIYESLRKVVGKTNAETVRKRGQTITMA